MTINISELKAYVILEPPFISISDLKAYMILSPAEEEPPPEPVNGLGFAEERRTDYHDWNDYLGTDGCDYDSFFISGFKIHAEMKNFNPMYVYFVSESHTDSSWFLQALWDFADTTLSNRWSIAQQGYRATEDRGWSHSRLKIRGSGPVLQFKVYSEEGKPFFIAGWSSLETANAAP